MIADAHCHLDYIERIEIPENMVAFTCGYSHESNRKNAEIAAERKNVYAVLGISPRLALQEEHLMDVLPEWIGFIRRSRPVGIGEIGLDFHYGKTETELKRESLCFEMMLCLAEEMGLPVVIHSRKATTAVLDVLGRRSLPMLFHCFEGNLEEAKRAVDMGGIISIPPIRSKNRRKVIKLLPLDKIVVETDAPDIGKTPFDIHVSIEMIAEIKGIGKEEVEDATYRNAMRFFRVG
jgi:TatD DNase family protein